MMRIKFMSLSRSLLVTIAVVPAVALVGCGGGSESGMDSAPMESSAPAPDPAPSSGGTPRVFFVAPEDGGEFSSDFDLEMEFGAENYEISPIPEGFDAETDTPRPDVGHFHVGIDTGGCLPVGTVIPQGEGWVHFGDGSNTFTMQSEPAEYELTLQIGDDAHRTQEGLCETISVTIADGI